jgi:hypothetical protein
MQIRAFSGADRIDVFDKAEYRVASGLSLREYEQRQKELLKKMKEFEESSIQQPYFGPEKISKTRNIQNYLFFGILILVVIGFLYLKNRGIL